MNRIRNRNQIGFARGMILFHHVMSAKYSFAVDLNIFQVIRLISHNFNETCYRVNCMTISFRR